MAYLELNWYIIYERSSRVASLASKQPLKDRCAIVPWVAIKTESPSTFSYQMPSRPHYISLQE